MQNMKITNNYLQKFIQCAIATKNYNKKKSNGQNLMQ